MMWPENQGVYAGTNTFLTVSGTSWTQLIASTPHDMQGFLLKIASSDTLGYTRIQLDIGVGASGSEQEVFPNYLTDGTGGGEGRYKTGHDHIWIPLSIPAGSRVSARKAGGASDSIYCDLIPVYGSLEHESVAIGKYIQLTGTTGTTVQTGTAGNFGSWVQLTSSTSQRISHVVLMTHGATYTAFGGNSFIYWEVAVGASGSEQTILAFTSMDRVPSAGNPTTSITAFSVPLSIPAGTRIAARSKNGNNRDYLNVGISMWGG